MAQVRPVPPGRRDDVAGRHHRRRWIVCESQWSCPDRDQRAYSSQRGKTIKHSRWCLSSSEVPTGSVLWNL